MTMPARCASEGAQEPEMASNVYVNRIATAVPDHEVNRFFIDFAASMLASQPRRRALFERMIKASGIERRYSCFAPAIDPNGPSVDFDGVFVKGAFPGTSVRMKAYERAAPSLAQTAVDRLLPGEERGRITHLIATSCTGFSAPGIDLELVARCGLRPSVERTLIGFMGCHAAINALKLARHIVRSDPRARVLIVNIELCTLHLAETQGLEKLLSFCLWGDGCAASLVSAKPRGLQLERFHVLIDRDSQELMSWRIGDGGFDMVLSGEVPAAIQRAMSASSADILDGKCPADIDLWAVHPGGRSILDAVQRALALDPAALSASREVLRLNGNMSSATIMFVMERMLKSKPGLNGCGMAFGPGLTAETMTFRTV
jgi:predicted naringenin-chalcone synthase